MAKSKKILNTRKSPLCNITIKKSASKKGKPTKEYMCSCCKYKTLDRNSWDKHVESVHTCKKCKCQLRNPLTHKCKKPKDERELKFVDINDTLFFIKQRSNKGAVVSLRHEYRNDFVLLEDATKYLYPDLFKVLHKYLYYYKSIRVQLSFSADCIESKTGERKVKTFHSPFIGLQHISFIDETVLLAKTYIENVIKMLTESESGIRVERLILLEVNIGIYKPICPKGFIPIPQGLRQRHGLLNINTTNDCFKLCVIAALFEDRLIFKKYSDIPVDQRTKRINEYVKRQMERPETYREVISFVEGSMLLDFSGFETNFDINDLTGFEEKNNLTVNIYEYDDDSKNVCPIRITRLNFGIQRHINLLLFTDEPNFHVVLIRNPRRFFGNHGKISKAVCPWCTQPVIDPDHLKKCKTMNDIGFAMPKAEEKFIKFNELHKLLPPPYRMYADFLYITNKSGVSVFGYAFLVIGPNKEIVDYKQYIGKDAMETFMPYVLSKAGQISTCIRQTCLPIPEMSTEEFLEFDKVKNCTVCDEKFSSANPKTRHHSHHIVGYQIQPVCQNCNLNIKPKYQIPLFSHTQSKLGTPMIIQNLKENDAASVHIIPKSNEKFMSIIFGNKLKLVDSRNFLDSSLPELVKNLVSSNKLDFLKLLQSSMDLEYLKSPWYFPHTWIDSSEKLNGPFPTLENFCDILEDRDIGVDEYNSFLTLYNKLNCITLKDYCLPYLESRVLQTAAVMETFGESCMNNYSLSPLNDISLPGFAYSVGLFHCKSVMEVPTDPEMVKTILENVRGGVSHLSQRIVTANSERLGHDNVRDEERTEILIADLNSLYQYCLAQPLPVRDYRRWTPAEITNLCIAKLPHNTGKGWIVVVSLHYPDRIKEYTKDYPLCATKHNIADLLLSDPNAFLPNDKLEINNLLLTQYDKEEVAIHYKLVQFFLKHGMEVTRVHQVIEFTEKAILKDFIDKNNQIRKSTTNKFDEKICKSIGNMLFGKFLSIHNNLNVKCSNSKAKAIKYLAKHDFEDFKIISDDITLFYSKKKAVKLDKNILIGFTVLDLAKLKLYELWYETIKPKFQNRCKFIASETDNFVAEIRDPGNTFIQDLRDIKHVFDFSTLPSDHPLQDLSRAKEPGLLKIEYPYPLQYVGIKSKLYSILNKCESPKCKAATSIGTQCSECKNVPKGCPKRKHTEHQVYLDTALGQQPSEPTNFLSFTSYGQNVKVETTKRNIFNTQEKHRIWLNHNESVPYGYFPPNITDEI